MSRLDLTVLCLLAAACGSGHEPENPSPDAGFPTIPDAPSAPTTGPLTTPLGSPTGPAITQTIGVAGGQLAEPTSGARAIVRSGSFAADATVTLQPVESLVPGAVGAAVSVAIDGEPAQGQRAFFQLPYPADLQDTAALHVAVQDESGAWLSVSPIHLEPSTRTITFALSLAAGAPAKLPAAAGSFRRVITAWKDTFYLVPGGASVKAGDSVTFTPYATGLVTTVDVSCNDWMGDDDCLPALPPAPIVTPVPFTNDKPGYLRFWQVNGTIEGDGEVGTIHPNAGIGAVYTAPAKKPSPSVVTVEFVSTDQTTTLQASAQAPVGVLSRCDPDSATGQPPPGCDWSGHVTVKIHATRSVDLHTVQPGCSPYMNCVYTEVSEHTIDANVTVQISGSGSSADSAYLMGTSPTGTYTESNDKMTHAEQTSTQGCVHFQDETVHEVSMGSPQIPPYTGSFGTLNISPDGSYMLVFDAAQFVYKGTSHTETHDYDCFNPEVDGHIDQDIDDVYFVSVFETGQLDPEKPDTVSGSAPYPFPSDGFDEVTATVTWELTRG